MRDTQSVSDAIGVGSVRHTATARDDGGRSKMGHV